MKKFSYKDFCDNISVEASVSPRTVNRVWKMAVKHVLKELITNGATYIPYVGEIRLEECKYAYKNKNKKFDWVTFKPFRIFLDGINLLGSDNDKELDKWIDKSHINEDDFVKQDYDEYVDKLVEEKEKYGDREILTDKIFNGQNTEDIIMQAMRSGKYHIANYKKWANKPYFLYEINGVKTIFTIHEIANYLGLKKRIKQFYEFYWKNTDKCYYDDVLIPPSVYGNKDIGGELWCVGTEEQMRRKGDYFSYKKFGG